MSERAPQQLWEKVVEILEVAVLALVAIATSFSGLQGTQWGGEQARLYGLASTTRFSPDYAAAFQDWFDTDPFHDPNAPPGPGYMPGLEDPSMAKAAALNA